MLLTQDPRLGSFSIFNSLDNKDKHELLDKISETLEINRSVGCLVGMAVGDMVGAPLEFLPASNKIKLFDIKKMRYLVTLNAFDLRFGQWTDDTSMGLCMADSLILKKKYDGSDIRIRFWNWWRNGYNNAFRFDKHRSESVGLGGNIAKSLMCLDKEKTPSPEFTPHNSKEDSGNGSLMRLASIPIFFRNNLDDVVEYSRKSSRTTHPGVQASDGCGLLGYIIASGIRRDTSENVQEFLDRTTKEYAEKYHPCNQIIRLIEGKESKESNELCWNWRENVIDIDQTMLNRGDKYNGYPNKRGYFGSYSVDGLAIALNSVYNTDSFNSAVERSVNYMGDADTTSAITGQIAGSFYGYDTIDKNLIEPINVWDNREIELRGVILALNPNMKDI